MLRSKSFFSDFIDISFRWIVFGRLLRCFQREVGSSCTNLFADVRIPKVLVCPFFLCFKEIPNSKFEILIRFALIELVDCFKRVHY